MKNKIHIFTPELGKYSYFPKNIGEFSTHKGFLVLRL